MQGSVYHYTIFNSNIPKLGTFCEFQNFINNSGLQKKVFALKTKPGDSYIFGRAEFESDTGFHRGHQIF